MTGRSHLVAGTASIPLADGLLHGLAATPVINQLPQVTGLLTTYHGMFLQGDGFAKVIWIVESILLFYIGTLLPDIDTGQSMIRKMTHTQSKSVNEDGHRTWTHSIWVILLLCVLTWKVSVCFWLLFGYATHLFWDMWSAMGICLLYPFQTYRKYGTGAKVAKGHCAKLYHTGQASEYVLVGVICTVSIVVLFFCHARYWIEAVRLFVAGL